MDKVELRKSPPVIPLIRRLNGVPEKNFLAFLDLLGAARLPPQPARVPLTFTLAAGVAAEAVVPAGTQVAAPPSEGEREPVIYETERELVVTAARLDAAFVREPEHDRYADLRVPLAAPSPSGAPAFSGDRHVEHVFYVGQDALFGLPDLKGVSLHFTLTKNVEPDPPPEASEPDPRQLLWEIWDGALGVPVYPPDDGTRELTRGGEIKFGRPTPDDDNNGEMAWPGSQTLAAHSPFPRLEVAGVTGRWLRCRLLTPITPSAEKIATMVRASELPTIRSVAVSVRLDSDGRGLPPDAAFSNAQPLDTTKDFLPFGESPAYNDAFYLASREALSRPGATVTLGVSPTDTTSTGVKSPNPSDDLKLRWEYWDGSKWAEMATVGKNGAATRGAGRNPLDWRLRVGLGRLARAGNVDRPRQVEGDGHHRGRPLRREGGRERPGPGTTTRTTGSGW